MAARYAETANRPSTRMKATRSETGKILRTMLNQIEVLAMVNGIMQYETLIREMNAVSERYKHQLAQAAGRRHKHE